MEVNDSGKWYCRECGAELILGDIKIQQFSYRDYKTGDYVVRATRRAKCPNYKWYSGITGFVNHSDGGIVFQSHLVPDDSKNGWVFISN